MSKVVFGKRFNKYKGDCALKDIPVEAIYTGWRPFKEGDAEIGGTFEQVSNVLWVEK